MQVSVQASVILWGRSLASDQVVFRTFPCFIDKFLNKQRVLMRFWLRHGVATLLAACVARRHHLKQFALAVLCSSGVMNSGYFGITR